MIAADVRLNILRKLHACRGHRAYGVSLLSCIPNEPCNERRLHNLCVLLFRQGLIERQKGMYSLTEAGVQYVEAK